MKTSKLAQEIEQYLIREKRIDTPIYTIYLGEDRLLDERENIFENGLGVTTFDGVGTHMRIRAAVKPVEAFAPAKFELFDLVVADGWGIEVDRK